MTVAIMADQANAPAVPEETKPTDEYIELAESNDAEASIDEEATAEPAEASLECDPSALLTAASRTPEASHSSEGESSSPPPALFEAEEGGRTLPKPPTDLPKSRSRRQGVQVQKFTRRVNKAKTQVRTLARGLLRGVELQLIAACVALPRCFWPTRCFLAKGFAISCLPASLTLTSDP